MTVPEDTRTQVERLVKADPTLSAVQIGRAAGVSRQRAHKILTDLGYALVWQKREK